MEQWARWWEIVQTQVLSNIISSIIHTHSFHSQHHLILLVCSKIISPCLIPINIISYYHTWVFASKQIHCHRWINGMNSFIQTPMPYLYPFLQPATTVPISSNIPSLPLVWTTLLIIDSSLSGILYSLRLQLIHQFPLHSLLNCFSSHNSMVYKPFIYRTVYNYIMYPGRASAEQSFWHNRNSAG